MRKLEVTRGFSRFCRFSTLFAHIVEVAVKPRDNNDSSQDVEDVQKATTKPSILNKLNLPSRLFTKHPNFLFRPCPQPQITQFSKPWNPKPPNYNAVQSSVESSTKIRMTITIADVFDSWKSLSSCFSNCPHGWSSYKTQDDNNSIQNVEDDNKATTGPQSSTSSICNPGFRQKSHNSHFGHTHNLKTRKPFTLKPQTSKLQCSAKLCTEFDQQSHWISNCWEFSEVERSCCVIPWWFANAQFASSNDLDAGNWYGSSKWFLSCSAPSFFSPSWYLLSSLWECFSSARQLTDVK